MGVVTHAHILCMFFIFYVHQFLLHGQKKGNCFLQFLAKEVINKLETDADWTIKTASSLSNFHLMLLLFLLFLLFLFLLYRSFADFNAGRVHFCCICGKFAPI